ncbi:MAG TPA: hypothetical protein VED40_04865 [Azospirillaceae bacterium]|nr:hypothetical protein [Azospirillaceae bacterium]
MGEVIRLDSRRPAPVAPVPQVELTMLAQLRGSLTELERSLGVARDRLAAIQAPIDEAVADCRQALEFCAACQEAWDLDDLEAMERRRDALRARLDTAAFAGATA